MGRTRKNTENANVEEKATTAVQEEQVVEPVQEKTTTNDVQEGQKTEDVQEGQATQDADASGQVQKEPSDNVESKEEIPPHVAKLMHLYPHYEEFWVTPRGFVHPAGVPRHLLKDAVLYKNKFYNK